MKSVLTSNHISSLKHNIELFEILTVEMLHPQKSKWTCDDFDVFEGIATIKGIVSTLKSIENNKTMYRKTKYSYAEDVQNEFNAILFRFEKAEHIVNHKRYGVMYNLIFKPLFDILIHQNADRDQICATLDHLQQLMEQDYNIGDVETAANIRDQNKQKLAQKHIKKYEEVLYDIIAEEMEVENMELNFNY